MPLENFRLIFSGNGPVFIFIVSNVYTQHFTCIVYTFYCLQISFYFLQWGLFMKMIAILSVREWSGKTTLAVHLAVASEQSVILASAILGKERVLKV